MEKTEIWVQISEIEKNIKMSRKGHPEVEIEVYYDRIAAFFERN